MQVPIGFVTSHGKTGLGVFCFCFSLKSDRYPFPWFGVGALEGPGKWNFSFVAPQLFAFLNATNGRRRLINFSTQPAWAYTGKKNSYPSDPLAVDWNYSNGLAPNANTTNLLADYYGRLVSWIVKGSFVDESGRVVGGGPAVGPGLQGYELFNEVDASCHDLTPESYSQQFDAITSQILKVVNPNPIKLVGLALASRNIRFFLGSFFFQAVNVTYFFLPF